MTFYYEKRFFFRLFPKLVEQTKHCESSLRVKSSTLLTEPPLDGVDEVFLLGVARAARRARVRVHYLFQDTLGG